MTLVALFLIVVLVIMVDTVVLGLLLVTVSGRVFLVSETAVQIVLLSSSRASATAGHLTASDSIPPGASLITGVHLGEEQTQDCLAIGPVQVIELHCDFLLGLGAILRRLVVFLGEFAAWLDQREELRLLMALLQGHLLFQLSSLFFFHLFHRLKEELFDI